MENLKALTTEQNNPDTIHIDECSTLEMVRLLNREDKKVAIAVERVLGRVAEAIDAIAGRLSDGGRLFYVGAGTSGRLGIIDASECPPTFGTPPDMVQGIIAGGNEAIINAAEGDEDNFEAGSSLIERFSMNDRDTILGIAASGRTPFVLGAMEEGNKIGALTVGLCNNTDVPMTRIAKIAITPVTGPEAIQGSTRLKAGSSQKMVLNMLSTGVMIKLGKIYKNLMVDMVPTNEKLVDRAKRIVVDATGCDVETAETVLKSSDYRVKVAIVAILGHDIETAEKLLDQHNGFVSKVLKRSDQP